MLHPLTSVMAPFSIPVLIMFCDWVLSNGALITTPSLSQASVLLPFGSFMYSPYLSSTLLYLYVVTKAWDVNRLGGRGHRRVLRTCKVGATPSVLLLGCWCLACCGSSWHRALLTAATRRDLVLPSAAPCSVCEGRNWSDLLHGSLSNACTLWRQHWLMNLLKLAEHYKRWKNRWVWSFMLVWDRFSFLTLKTWHDK